MIALDKMQAAFESAYPAASRARNGDDYGGGFGSMFIVWQAAVASCAPVEQVDALTDEQIVDEIDRPGFAWENLSAAEQRNLLGSIRAVIAATRTAAPVQAAPEGITDTERLNYIAEKSVLGASYCNITSINTIVHLEDFAAGGTRYAIDCMIERKAAAPAPRSAK